MYRFLMSQSPSRWHKVTFVDVDSAKAVLAPAWQTETPRLLSGLSYSVNCTRPCKGKWVFILTREAWTQRTTARFFNKATRPCDIPQVLRDPYVCSSLNRRQVAGPVGNRAYTFGTPRPHLQESSSSWFGW